MKGFTILAVLLALVATGCGDDKKTKSTDGKGGFRKASPLQPAISIQPEVPITDSAIWAYIAQPEEGVTYRYQWFRNGSLQDYPENQTAVATDQTGISDVWKLKVEPLRGSVTGPTAQATATILPTWRTLSAGTNHACRITPDGEATCWGNNAKGQLGNGTSGTGGKSGVKGDAVWFAVGAGVGHSCGVKKDGTLWCWGENQNKQAGSSGENPQPTPVQIGSDHDWVYAAAGSQHSCALKSDRTFWCWGDNLTAGQLGEDHLPRAAEPVLIGYHKNWLDLSLGDFHTCGVRSDGALQCWGSNSQGQVGGVHTNTGVPQDIAPDKNWYMVAAGKAHTCAVTSGGELWCWGANANGQLGTGNTAASATPVRVGTDANWYRAAAGASHSCAIKRNRSLWCWGADDHGQLGGDGSSPQPVQIDENYHWVAVVAGGNQTCALRDNGTLKCWGENTP